MFEDIFEKRDKKLNRILKIGSFLGRALRENVELFKYDSEIEKAFYLTETGKIVSGKIVNSALTGIEVNEVSDYLDENKFNKLVGNHISRWLGDLYKDKYMDAQKDFTYTISLWEERLKLDKLNKILEEKSTSLNENKDILKTKEFNKLVEITPSLVKFLKENKDKISSVPEIKNSVILSNTVANAFGVKKITYKKLIEGKKFEIDSDENSSTIFDLITKQELIKKELLESKRNFESVWLTNKKIQKLAECINENEDEVQKALSEVLISIPYFAILSKKQLSEMFNNIINVSEELVAFKDIQKYSSYIFEVKKTVRNEIIKILNEKYGINVQNLKDVPSFKSLLNTQIVIFETLRRLLPKDSINRAVLKEVCELLKNRDGVEAIDVNDYIHKLFTESTYSFISEGVMTRYLDFDRIADDLGSVSQILKMIKGSAMGQQMPQMGGSPMAQSPMTQNPALGAAPQMSGAQMPTGGKSEEDLGGGLPTQDDAEAGMQPEMGMDPMGGLETPPTEMGGNQLAGLMAELEEIISGLKVELGQDPDGGMDGLEPGMEGEEGFNPEEGIPGEEGFNPEEGGEEFGQEDEGEGEEFGEEEPEEGGKPEPKGKGFPPKKEGKGKEGKSDNPKPEKKDKKPVKKDKKESE